MKRKNICVCVSGYDWEYETRIVNGVYDRCMSLDINLLVFANLMRRPNMYLENKALPENIIHGEIEIFNLINYDILDGIIIVGESLLSYDVLYDIVTKAKEKNIPIININDNTHDVCTNIRVSDKNAMEFVVKHLVEDHGLTKINFIGGNPGNPQTEERLAAYKKVLEEHNIPIEEDRIAYGEFWKKAYNCTACFMEKEDKPQAIVCASDTMAFFCMDYLKEHGYNIPQDIVVTGFDGIKDGEMYSPTVTTVRRGFQESGEAAVDTILEMIEGKEVPHDITVESVLVKNQSCGCAPKTSKRKSTFYDTVYGNQNRFLEFNAYSLEMNTSFSSAKNSTDLYLSLDRGVEFFKLKKLYVCICKEVEKGKRSFDTDETGPAYARLSDKMLCMFSSGSSVCAGTEFRTSELVPQDLLNGDKSEMIAFSPMYFKDRILGYIAYQPSRLQGSGDLFATWLTSISNNAGSFYMNNELEFVIDELENLYIRDPLTGLYNRRGMVRLGYQAIEKAQAEHKWVSIVCADIDNLKQINDIYGHEAGDNAILRCAKAIEQAMPKEAICTRTGGDEYCVILSHGDKEAVNKYISDIDGYLSEYNGNSKLPYKVGCSCGFASINYSDIISIDQMVKVADENMYKVKAMKKTNRANRTIQ